MMPRAAKCLFDLTTLVCRFWPQPPEWGQWYLNLPALVDDNLMAEYRQHC
jgi:hypothetical protein